MIRRFAFGSVLALVAAGCVIVPPPPGSDVFVPDADSYVDASNPTGNFGTAASLRADGSPVRTSYIRFDVQGVGSPASAVLRVRAETSSSVGFEVRSVSDNSWDEATITDDNAPPVGSVINTSGRVTAGLFYDIDVSSVVTGDGLVTLALTRTDSTALRFSSREGDNPPQLLVPAPPAPSPFVVTRHDNHYRATSQTTGVIYAGTLKFAVESAVGALDLAGGGTVTFDSGTFEFGSDHLEFYDVDDVVFEGQGIGVTVLVNDSDAATDTEPFDFTNSDRITIRDLTVTAAGAPRTTSDAIDFDQGNDVTVERVEIAGSRARGIVFDGKDLGGAGTADRNVIRDCEIHDVPGDGIELLASSENLVEGCEITDVGGHGIQINKSSPSADQPNKKSNDNVVTSNVVDESGRDGINVISGDRNEIRGNTITNSSDDVSSRDGIRITTTDSITCDDNVVDVNTATDTQAVKTQRYGLNITDPLCHRTVVSDNVFTGNLSGEIRDLGTDTQYTTNDTEAPTVPTNLAAAAVDWDHVDLTWSASTDNFAVTGYTVYRDAVAVAVVGGTTLSYTDTGLTADTTYSYTVDAVDAAGNRSAPSSPLSVTTSSVPPTVTLTAEADTYVSADTPTTNYGASTALRIDTDPDGRAYLRFDVQGLNVPIQSATLRVFAESSSSVGYVVHDVADDTWDEATVTYATAPAVGSAVGGSGVHAAGVWIEVDVTALVTGNGQWSLALVAQNSTQTSYGSRESANPPELVLDFGP